MRRPLVAGNWKMNGSKESLVSLMQSIAVGCDHFKTSNMELVVFPPFVYLEQAEKHLTGTCVAWGAQDLCSESNGAYTGEISATMLNDFHCRYVIVGHSERRHIFGETDQQIATKFNAALKSNLRPILCVGETNEQREKGLTDSIIMRQLESVFSKLPAASDFDKIVVAYEPVWAIGTGKTATPDQVQEVHTLIRNQLKKYNVELASKARIIYGGSVNSGNAHQLCHLSDVDGVLVGGASLDANQFIEIGKLCK